jgi:2'-5' RNA ligase
VSALAPSRDSALIVAVRLPPGLEALRLAYVPDALAEGIGAHVTLLYPFAAPAALDQGLIDTVTAIVRRHPGWSMTLAGRGRFPDTLYATVEPDAPIRALQAELAAAFPTLPLYGDPGLRFAPHVTIVEGPRVDDPRVAGSAAWGELPVTIDIHEVELIVRDAGRWRTARAFPLG